MIPLFVDHLLPLLQEVCAFDDNHNQPKTAMSMIPVSSTAIMAIGYSSGTLGVQFHSSSTIYEHPGVPFSLFTEFLAADSKGDFYHQRIKGVY